MREIRVTVSLPDGDLHDWAGAYGMDDLCPVPVYRLELLADCTVAFVGGFEGDPDRVREHLAADETVIDVTVGEEPGLLHCRFEPRPMVRRMLETLRETPLVLGTPLYLNGDGSVTATFYGDEGTFAETVEAVPDEVVVEIDRMRDVTSPDASGFDRLTDRQREVARAAVEAGYFDRDGPSAAEMAERLDISKATLSEHLGTVQEELVTQAFGGER